MPIVSNSCYKIGNKKPQIRHKSPQIGSADFYLFNMWNRQKEIGKKRFKRIYEKRYESNIA